MTPGPRILVVDDTPANVRLLEAVLRPRGYEMLTASSGPEALAAVARDRPDLVLLDIVMPGMDGYEVCRRIRSGPATAFLPVVMITASGHQEKTRALEAGADDFVSKPFDKSELLARVASLARIKRYHDTISRQAAELAEPASTFFIAEVGGRGAGYAKLHAGEPPEGVEGAQPVELVRLYVLREWLGRGVGEALMRACVEEAQRAGHGTIWLGVWERNGRAQAFYRKWDFHVVGEHVFQLGSDPQRDILMERTL